MSRNRFEEIKRHLHFADNTKAPDDPPKDYKFSPLIDQFNKIANKIEPGESLSVDEQIMPCKGKQSGGLRQYKPQKPKKWGYKFFLLYSKYGLVHHLELYKGKHETAVIPDHKLGKSSAVVVRLLQHIKKRVKHKVLFDNWFSSPDLLNHLSSEGFQALCTVCLCRVPGRFMASDADLKKLGRGAYDCLLYTSPSPRD